MSVPAEAAPRPARGLPRRRGRTSSAAARSQASSGGPCGSLALVVVDITGLTIGLYLALALRALVRDPKPILWNLLWNAESDWLPFLVLLMLLVFWRNRLYGPRELREGAGQVVAVGGCSSRR